MHFTVLVPVYQTIVPVVPGRTVNDAAVSRNATGLHVAYRLVPVVQFGLGKLLCHAVHPFERRGDTSLACPADHRTVRRHLADFRIIRITCRRLYLRIVPVEVEQNVGIVQRRNNHLAVIGHAGGLTQLEQRFGERPQFVPFVLFHIDYHGIEYGRARFVLTIIETADILSVRRHRRQILKNFRSGPVTREGVVSDHLHHFDDLFRLAGRYGYLRLPYFVGIVIDDLDGKRSGRHIGYLHPRGRRFGLPRRRIGVHLDGHGPVARSLKRTCGIAQPDVLRVGPAGCRTPPEQGYTRERQSSPDVKSLLHNSSKHLAVIQNRFIKYTVRLVSLSSRMQPTHFPSVFANICHMFYYNNNIYYHEFCFYP